MALFKKTYTPDYFNKLRHKHNYNKLSKLLKHDDISVATMAKKTLQELIDIEEEKSLRENLYELNPEKYDKIIKRFEAVQLSNSDLNLDSIIRVFVQDREPLRLKKQVEEQEIENLSNLLKEKGVHSFTNKNVKDLKALLEPDESIECAMQEGSRGNLIVCHDFTLYTNKNIFILTGFANHDDWGKIDQMSYGVINEIKERGVFVKKYEICGNSEFLPFIIGEDNQLIKQLIKYGSEEIKMAMKQLGIPEEESTAQ